jgi:signal peptidase II
MAPAAPPLSRRRLIATIAVIVVALDAASKALAAHYLAGCGRVEVLGGAFHLELYRNFAGPGDSFQGHTVLISLFALAAVAALVVIATRVVTTTSAIALGLMLGGAVGNLLDRLLRDPGPLRGGVVDWLKPTPSSGSMNIADLAINAAVGAMLVGAILAWWRSRSAGENPAATEAPSP